MTRLLLVRHAESEWNARGLWQGLADPPLSPLGEHQAVLAGQRLRPMGISAMVSSGLRRSRATAERIAPALGLTTPLAVDADLREYDVGAWSGLTRTQIEAQWPGAIEEWRHGRLFATPGGERNDSFVARISTALVRIAGQRPGETVLVITHGGVMNALSRSLGSLPRRFPHLSGLWIDSESDGLRTREVIFLLHPDPPGRSDQPSQSDLAAAVPADRPAIP